MRGYKLILLLLFLAVNAFALTPNENITNIAWSVKSNAQYSVQGNAAGLTNGGWITRRQNQFSEWDWSFNFKTWTNENPVLSIYNQGSDSLRFVGSADNTPTNNVAITNGVLTVNPTNEVLYYWNRATAIPVQRVRISARTSTNGVSAGGISVDDSYILVQRNPMVTGQSVTVAGQTNWFMHFFISRYGVGFDIYTNGLNGLVYSTTASKDVPVPQRMKEAEFMDIGFDILDNGKGDTIEVIYGNYVRTFQSSFLTNLFAPMTGFGTNVTFELIRHYPIFSSLEWESLAYSTTPGASWPVGAVPFVGTDGIQAVPSITVTQLSSIGPISTTNTITVSSNATFNNRNTSAELMIGGKIGAESTAVALYRDGVVFLEADANFTILQNPSSTYLRAGGVNGLYVSSANANILLPAFLSSTLFTAGNSTSATHTATSLIAGGGGISSATTNATLTMAAGGITNTTAIQYTIYGFTGTGVVLTNLSRPINITLGTITAPATIVLQPNDALMGTICAAAGDRGF